jgi:hypothetical protein
MHSTIKTSNKTELLIIIHIPWLFSEIFQFNALLSYYIAWLGSFLIFYLSIFSSFRYLSIDLPLSGQIMRPIIFIQLIFAGFMCCTSIFYALDQIYNAFDPDLDILAKCQRLSLLAHTALVAGMILLAKAYPTHGHSSCISKGNYSLRLTLFFWLFAGIIDFLPILIQFKFMLLCLASILATYCLVEGLVEKHLTKSIFGSLMFSTNLYQALSSGYKEIVIVNFITILFIAYPYFKRTVMILMFPIIYLLLFVLPTFTTIIRLKSWKENKTIDVAREQAYNSFFNEDMNDNISLNNWLFLTNRLSEIAMFTKFVKDTPAQHPYYGFSIIENSIHALIPRGLWQEKPNTEKVSMERVYLAGVADRSSSVSAKSRPVTDGYLIAGIPGVYMLMVVYGLTAQLLCNLSEKLFGGYQLGCIIMFNGIFQQMWRGNNLEFLSNNVFYGFILLIVIFLSMKGLGMLTKEYKDGNIAH